MGMADDAVDCREPWFPTLRFLFAFGQSTRPGLDIHNIRNDNNNDNNNNNINNT